MGGLVTSRQEREKTICFEEEGTYSLTEPWVAWLEDG